MSTFVYTGSGGKCKTAVADRKGDGCSPFENLNAGSPMSRRRDGEDQLAGGVPGFDAAVCLGGLFQR